MREIVKLRELRPNPASRSLLLCMLVLCVAQLALWQAHHVADRLRAKFPDITFKGQSRAGGPTEQTRRSEIMKRALATLSIPLVRIPLTVRVLLCTGVPLSSSPLRQFFP